MRALIQRVRSASVEIKMKQTAAINHGLLVLIGIETLDTDEDVKWLSQKLSGLRIFSDQDQNMNLNIKDVDGEVLLVSQFTLHAKTKKGNRPSFIKAARPEQAIPLYNLFIKQLDSLINKKTKTSLFGAMMNVSLVNDGPVTIMIDSKNRE